MADDDQEISFGEYSIAGVDRINVLLGKNGCGKSTALRTMYRNAHTSGRWQSAKYITPERAGQLNYEPNIEHNISTNVGWMLNTRLTNQFNQFKAQTMVLYRQLHFEVLQRFEAEHEAGKRDGELPPYFSTYVKWINQLLDNVEIKAEAGTFRSYDRVSSNLIPATEISSGESELIALAIEALVFALSASAENRGLLLIDSPDVHLHPDLQARLMKFLIDLIDEYEFDVVIATHSTPILGELVQDSDSGANVCFMRARDKSLTFRPVDKMYKELLPVFGAHPLTQIFNSTRTLLVEGDDDVRVWQEAVKTSNGALKITPVGVGGKDNMSTYEERMGQIVSSVYDSGIAYSLRDRDDRPEAIDDQPPVIRMRLSCRSAENLLLSDEVLSSVNVEWGEIQSRISAWCATGSNQTHEKHDFMKAFLDDGMPRKTGKLKEIRMLLVGQILETEKPWEVLVGKAIGRLFAEPADSSSGSQDSLRAYLGDKVGRTFRSVERPTDAHRRGKIGPSRQTVDGDPD